MTVIAAQVPAPESKPLMNAEARSKALPWATLPIDSPTGSRKDSRPRRAWSIPAGSVLRPGIRPSETARRVTPA